MTGLGGPKPFVSWKSYRLPDQSEYLWESRHHRKGAGPRAYADRVGLGTRRSGENQSTKSPWLRFWGIAQVVLWIASIFMVGSAFFVVGAAGSLAPEAFGSHHRMSVFAETCYLVGATLYTASIYGQVLETINADRTVEPDRRSRAPRQFRWFAFEVTHLVFLVPFVLLLGPLVFNYETVFALGSSVQVLPHLGLWVTSLLGAVLFLISGVSAIHRGGARLPELRAEEHLLVGERAVHYRFDRLHRRRFARARHSRFSQQLFLLPRR